MAHGAKKTEHSGAKKGAGAYYGRKAAAKHESSRTRRKQAKAQVKQGTKESTKDE
jgi:hypothetical protein